jgi:arylsulfatase
MRWPGRIPAHTECNQMLMTIDLFPTIGKLIDAELPKHKIDGQDVWPIISGKRDAKNPHTAYWFYYEANQLQAVVSGDGRWKLQLPHTYRTLAGRPGGQGGTPAPYEPRKVERAELYDLANDISEAADVSVEHPDIVKRLQAEAEKARQELGDSLTKRQGTGAREPGRLAQN